jgi:hypothetical protein
MKLATCFGMLLCCAVSACAHAPPPEEPALAGPRVVRQDPANPRAEAVWQAVLELYASGTVVSKGAALLDRPTQSTAAGRIVHARIVLMDSAAHPYARPWLDSLAARHLIDGVCSASEPWQCADTVATSYLALADPRFSGDTAVDVAVDDQGFDRGACHGGQGRVFGGFVRSVLHLARHQGPWRLIESNTTSAGDFYCQ